MTPLQAAHASGQLSAAQSQAHYNAGELSLPCPACGKLTTGGTVHICSPQIKENHDD